MYIVLNKVFSIRNTDYSQYNVFIINPLEPKIQILSEIFQYLVDSVLATYLGYTEKSRCSYFGGKCCKHFFVSHML